MFNLKSNFIIILLVLLAVSCNDANTEPTSVSLNLYDIVNQEIDSMMSNTIFQSASVAVIKNDTVFTYHTGVLVNMDSPTDSTLYEIASLTKTFTGTLLAKAISENKLSLDDDVRNYLEGTFPNLEYNSNPITFRHLVTHTSGLPGMFPDNPELFSNPDMDELPFKINQMQSGFTRKDFVNELHKIELDTVPGIKLQYSNAGANLVALCLENIYDAEFNKLLRDHLLNPLGMENTYINISDTLVGKIAVGQNVDGYEMPLRANKDLNAEGGIITNIGDMIKYMKYHLKQNDDVVSTSHQELFEGKYGEYEAGLFWQILKPADQPRRLFQNGGAFGTSCWMTLIPETNTGVFLITNVSAPDVHPQLNSTINKILKRIEHL